MRRIRQIQNTSQQSDEEVKQPVKALWKLSKFDSVPSRVKEQLQVIHHLLTLLFSFYQLADGHIVRVKPSLSVSQPCQTVLH